MLGSSKLEAFIGTANPDKARQFYETVLGLEFISDRPFALEFNANGVTLLVSKVEKVEAAAYTVLGWRVTDIKTTIQGLRKVGVQFERYSFFEQDDLGVWVSPNGAKVAWFKDPDGNLLSVAEY